MRAPGLGDRAPLPADPSACPPLPEAARELLVAGLEALATEQGGGAAPGTEAAVEAHLRLLLAWTTAINLTAIRDPAAAVRGHILDSLAALPLLRAAGVDVLLDVGSGGGYPGFPLAAGLPARHVLLVDSIAKKVRFLETAIEATGLGGRVAAAAVRAEELAADPAHREAWQAVTARAIAPLAELVELAFPLLATGGLLLAWKREPLGAEQTAALPAIAALGGGSLDVHPLPPALTAVAGLAELREHRLVVVTKAGPTGAAWPRTPSERRRRPW